jgi:hypothetical protein
MRSVSEVALGRGEPLAAGITIDHNMRVRREFGRIFDADYAAERMPDKMRRNNCDSIIQLVRAPSGRSACRAELKSSRFRRSAERLLVLNTPLVISTIRGFC